MKTITENYVAIACAKCGHEADYMDFTHTPIHGSLPRDTFQCPQCHRAWAMEIFTEGQYYPSGLWIPAGRRSVTVPSFL
jgi:predicted RNA-binding Zn-ribbon protein involved in translation (DUF1610 family)